MTSEGGGGSCYRWYRSYLYVPAIEFRRIERALASEADAVIVDLEDAVPQNRKDEARRAARALLLSVPAKPVFVRVNSYTSGLLEADIDAVACRALAGIRLPKAESAEQVRTVVKLLSERGCNAQVVPIIESALGVERAFEIASVERGVVTLAVGEADLRLDLGTTAEETLDYARVRCIVATRAAALPGPIQSVCTQLHDEQLLWHTTRKGRAMGFSGRSAIHPRQLRVINDAFTPSEAECRWAYEIVDASRRASASGAVVAVTDLGEFVDEPVLRRASAILALCAPGQVGR